MPTNNTETWVQDESDRDSTTAPIQYSISSFGADYDVDGLVRRIRRGDIFLPSFQRDYVWNHAEASRLIESLLLGLPIPGIFLAKEVDTNRLLVIDGQQRLKTLRFFYDGYFNPVDESRTQKVFRLTKVQPEFEGLTYDSLAESDKRKLDNTIIHATIVKQEYPEGDNTSIYHIFERLNNGGRKLTPQEIRVAIYHGSLMEMIIDLNNDENWRIVFGKKNKRLKDQELILRFLALLYDGESYLRPMQEFLNRFAKQHQRADATFINGADHIFRHCISVIREALGPRAFRPERALNAAVFDSVMVGLARRLRYKPAIDMIAFERAYYSLLKDERYVLAVSSSTADEKNVMLRLELATVKFSMA